MFDRFTDHAKRAMNLARQEAQRLGHEHLGTEHILLALAREGSGVAADVLQKMGHDLGGIRINVERSVETVKDTSWEEMKPFTFGAKSALEFSIEEARNLGHNWIGTEHLLLGLIKVGHDVAAKILLDLGIQLVDAREQVIAIYGTGAEVVSRETRSEPPPLPAIAHLLRQLTREERQVVRQLLNDIDQEDHPQGQ